MSKSTVRSSARSTRHPADLSFMESGGIFAELQEQLFDADNTARRVIAFGERVAEQRQRLTPDLFRRWLAEVDQFDDEHLTDLERLAAGEPTDGVDPSVLRFIDFVRKTPIESAA